MISSTLIYFLKKLNNSLLIHLQKQLSSLLVPDYIDSIIDHNELTLWIYPGSLIRSFTLLSNDPRFLFNQLVDITAVDYPHKNQRFEVVYHLLSLTHNLRLRVKINLSENNAINSIEKIFPSANWFEREIWDMFGIVFENHTDLRRILSDYEFSGFPLRKDFPLSGYTQTKYDSNHNKIIREPVALSQPHRNFDFTSPWEGSSPVIIDQQLKNSDQP